MQVFDRASPTSPAVLVAVAVGGALGAGARWLVGWQFTTIFGAPSVDAWPWPTFVVNVAGAFAIGLAATLVVRESVGWAFTITGVLGGFTTYSAFAVEVDRLAEAGRTGLAATYAAATIVAGVAAVAVASAVARRPTR